MKNPITKPKTLLFLPITLVVIDIASLPAQSSANDTTFPIIDTNQSTCYQDTGSAVDCPAEDQPFYGQDAQYSVNPSSYTQNGDGTVSDNVTGLMWQQSADTDGSGEIDASDKLSYEAANTYCENLSLAGHDDWRLPDIKTLYSLIDFNGTDASGYDGPDTSILTPFIDDEAFDFAYGDHLRRRTRYRRPICL